MTVLENSPATDEVLHAISNEQRRLALRVVCQSDEPSLPLETLVARVAKRAATASPSRRAIRIQFEHVHLPVLEDSGICSYDADADLVEYTGGDFTESLLEFLAARPETSIR
jgi:hypothetical protein